MADDSSNEPGPFNLETIEYLIGLMSKHDISEMDLTQSEQRIRLRRGARVIAASHPVAVSPAPVALPATQAPAQGAAAPPPEKTARKLIEIKSPAIGTFYLKEKPEATQPYVNVGSRVTPTTTVGLIEAMKLFSEIPAGCSGVIEEILVENGHAVEYNQVLFRVDPSR